MTLSTTALYQRGLDFLRERRYAQAEGDFHTVLQHNRGFAPAYHQLARLAADQGRLDEARRFCQEALVQDPLSVEVHYTLALVLQEAGEMDEALATLRKALYLEPEYILAHFSLATLYDQTARPAEAARHRRQAVRLAARQDPEARLPYPDGLRVGEVLAMLQERE